MQESQEIRLISPVEVSIAYNRIKNYIYKTPIVYSTILDNFLGHNIFFKVECQQRTGAFKIRGAVNALLSLQERNKLPREVVAFSSGNHAQAVAIAANMLGVKAKIILPNFTSTIKQQATKYYGAEIINTKTRKDAEDLTKEIAQQGAYPIYPFNDDQIIIGQGTACYEALNDKLEPDAIFASCGGGGLVSGTFLAKNLLYPKAKIFASEPLQANDAAQSYKANKIIGFADSPQTIADGARTPKICERTFNYLKQIDGFFEITEEQIIYWTQWLMHLLKITVEPTAALAMAGAFEWLKMQKYKQTILVILSGGNIAQDTYKQIWLNDNLKITPSI